MKNLIALFSSTALLTASASATLAAYQEFEGDGFGSWAEAGEAFGKGPSFGEVPGMKGTFAGFLGKSFAASAHQGLASTGSLTSPEFKISTTHIHFLVAGGNHADETAVQLIINGAVVREATGLNDLQFRVATWKVKELQGQTARLRILDQHAESFIAADHVIMDDNEKPELPEKAAPSHAEKLAATPAIAGNLVPPGTSLKIFADHQTHGVTSPTAFTFDKKGALYVAETHRFRFGVEDNRNHLYWYLDDLASQTTDDRRALHEKWQKKVSLDWMTKKSEVVRKLTDSDGDGTADDMSVFADGFNDVLDGTAAGVFAYLGKVYFACIPKIHILEDTTGDGKADQRDVVADGFGVRISLSGHDMNGFALGNDGRIYGTIGDRGFSVTTREGVKYHYPDQGAIFRFEPGGDDFEVVHTGLRNPKEIAFDEFGNGITVDNNSDQSDRARIVYLMDGADSGWNMHHQALFTFRNDIGLTESPPSPWMSERMWEPQNDDQPAFIVPAIANLTNGPSGLTYHPGTGFLESERGRFLICDYKASPAASGIYSFRVSRDGAGMGYNGAHKLNWGVTPTDVEYSYDGRLFVADFIGGWTSHEGGRIYTLSADAEENGGRTPDVAALMAEGFDHRPVAELAGLLGHADQRLRLRAHIQLASMKDGTESLIAATREPQLLTRLHGIWGLGIRARKEADKEAASTLMTLLVDKDAEVRAQAAQVLAEVPKIDSSKLIPLLQDPSLRVRSFAALAIGRQKPKGATSAILQMLEENADQDRYLRHAGIVALQGTSTAEEIAKLAEHETSAVRMAAVVALRRMKSPLISGFLVDAEPRVADEAIRAIHDLPIDEARPDVAALLDGYLGSEQGRPLSPMIARRIIHSTFRVGGTANASRLISAAASPQLDLPTRLEALRLLRQWKQPFPVDQSLGRWAPLPKRDVALIVPTLEAGLNPVLTSDGALLESALHLVADLELDGESFTEDALAKLVTSDKVPADARVTALDLWASKNPAAPDAILGKLIADPSDDVANKALELLVSLKSPTATEALEKALASPSAARRQAAWIIAAQHAAPTSAALINKALGNAAAGKGDPATRLELVESAELRDEPEVKAALEAFLASQRTEDPLSPWQYALEGGNPERGEETFRTHGSAQCLRCHAVGESKEGAMAGPNLAGIGKLHDRAYLLEALVLPGAKVAPGFGIVSLTLNNGGTLGGIMLEETDLHYDVAVGTDQWRILKSDVKSATPPMSAMPPMSSLLSPRELRDMVAYLATLEKPADGPAEQATPKPFDPASVAPGN